MARMPRTDQFFLGGAGADIDHAAVVGLLGAGHDGGVFELRAAFLDDEEGRPAHRPNQHRAEEEGHGAADQQADEHLGIGHREEAGEVVVLWTRHLLEVLLAAHGDHGDEAGEQRDGGDHGRADGDALGFGLGGIAHGVEVGQDLPGPLVSAGGMYSGSAGLHSRPLLSRL